ncbi:unnamed protein product [Schistosoma mattheei]|uniref:Uncharacterized protein n=1 Tax=Schistosoma mattheei TaxID=31246 RepID=A0A183NMM2_9TREM|nr:unnamed protein product [Schistosoma mattheei]
MVQLLQVVHSILLVHHSVFMLVKDLKRVALKRIGLLIVLENHGIK